MSRFKIFSLIAFLFIADLGFSARRGHRGGGRRRGTTVTVNHNRGGARNRNRNRNRRNRGPAVVVRTGGRRAPAVVVRAGGRRRAPAVVVRGGGRRRAPAVVIRGGGRGRVFRRPARVRVIRPMIRRFKPRGVHFGFVDFFGRPCPVNIPVPFYVDAIQAEINLLQAVQTGTIRHIQRALNNGARLNVRNADGRTALHLAVEARRPRIVEFLLSFNRLHINAQDAWGETALHMAARNGYRGIVERLVQRGASAYIQDNSQSTAPMIADEFGFPGIADYIIQYARI